MSLTQDQKKTEDIRKELAAAPNLAEYLSENQEYFSSKSVPELLEGLYRETKLSKAEVARRSGMSSVYLHQIFSGKRNPSRDKLICLCIGMNVELEGVQALLKNCGFAELYVKDKRDAVILFGITHGQSLHEINDTLFDQGVDTLI